MLATVPIREARRSRWLIVPPPLLFALSFVAGLGVERLAALPLVPAALQAGARTAGIGLLILAALLLVPAPALFLRHRTTIVPHRRARTLVTSGPYRVTRNPMYLALSTAYVGAALWLGAGWSLLFLALPLWVLDRRVIPFEEASLASTFGDDYVSYRQRVRRWI